MFEEDEGYKRTNERGIFGEDQGYIVERVRGIFGSQMLTRERVKKVP